MVKQNNTVFRFELMTLFVISSKEAVYILSGMFVFVQAISMETKISKICMHNL